MKSTVVWLSAVTALWALAPLAAANPYPDPRAVPVDRAVDLPVEFWAAEQASAAELRESGSEVLRVDLKWDEASDSFALAGLVREQSGTEALLQRTRRVDRHGSYKGALYDATTGELIAASSRGTGADYRRLVRGVSFRFPMPAEPVTFKLTSEHPQSGDMETTLELNLDPADAVDNPLYGSAVEQSVETRLIKAASASPKLIVAIYAEGYRDGRKASFWRHAEKVPQALQSQRFPMEEHFEYVAVFAPSRRTIGSAQAGPLPVPERDSFLGLYFPYWHRFGRWYHVVYPTSEIKYRNTIGLVPYDYAVSLVDSSSYWGVGNFKELTAIPAENSSFSYLLLHEIGHFFGLNEEYTSGGPTELRFAPDIKEPWSQNITFTTDRARLKWGHLVSASTPLPTPSSAWVRGRRGPFGAYRGGYASSDPHGRSHIPSLQCTMEAFGDFCEVCKAALRERVTFDLGL